MASVRVCSSVRARQIIGSALAALLEPWHQIISGVTEARVGSSRQEHARPWKGRATQLFLASHLHLKLAPIKRPFLHGAKHSSYNPLATISSAIAETFSTDRVVCFSTKFCDLLKHRGLGANERKLHTESDSAPVDLPGHQKAVDPRHHTSNTGTV